MQKQLHAQTKDWLLSKLPVLLFMALQILWAESMAQSKGVLNNRALHFDGVNDFVNINKVGRLIASLDTFSVEFEVKVDTQAQSGTGHRALFAINQASSGSNELLIVLGNGSTNKGNILVFDNNGASKGLFEITSTKNIGDNSCHQIAYVRTKDTGKIYIDGVLDGSHHIGYSIDSTKKISIGQEWDGTTPSDFVNAIFSEFRIWSSARTTKELRDNRYKEMTLPQKNLLVYYKFDQGYASGTNTSETRLIDFSGNSADGILNNFALSGKSSNWITDSCFVTYPCTKIDTVLFHDTITIFDTLLHADTTFVTYYDTIVVYDTLIIKVFDTTYTSVQDTLIFKAKLTGTVPIAYNTIKVFPNPAQDHLTIDLGDYMRMSGYQVEIKNTLGQTIHSSTVSSKLMLINLNTWTGKGLYHLYLLDKSKNLVSVKKIIIQ